MSLFTKIQKLIMKQYIIDSGQLGGLYDVVFSALGILGLITFINTSINCNVQ